MIDVLRTSLGAFDRFIIGYFLLFNSIFLLLIVIGGWELVRARRRVETVGLDEVFAYPLTPSISVVVPAFNEEVTIVDSVHGMLSLRYPSHEVVVVDDGSTDATFDLLREEFDLVEVEGPHDGEIPTIGAVHSVHQARDDDRLRVVRKSNAGTRADAINAGINAARHPLVCMTDADSIFDPDTLLIVVRPFLEDPDTTVGVGGTIRAINGSEVVRGQLERTEAPPTWIGRIQVVEYLRSFLLGRVAWSRLGALVIISGAFGVYRRDVLVELNGLDPDALAEDAELVTRLHRDMRRSNRRYRLRFLPDPVCWTEVPDSPRELAKQRRRWSRGLAEMLWTHRRMIGNPRHGRIGLVALPYYLLFELLGAVVELVGVWAIILGLVVGVVDVPLALLFAATAILYAIVLSAFTVAFEEFSYRRYSRWRDLAAVGLAGVVENLGFRQLHAWWRVQGLLAAIRGTDTHWEKPARRGFRAPSPSTGDDRLIAAGTGPMGTS